MTILNNDMAIWDVGGGEDARQQYNEWNSFNSYGNGWIMFRILRDELYPWTGVYTCRL